MSAAPTFLQVKRELLVEHRQRAVHEPSGAVWMAAGAPFRHLLRPARQLRATVGDPPDCDLLETGGERCEAMNAGATLTRALV